MSDIVERIRGLRFVHVPGTSQLMEEAAAEIERLRSVPRWISVDERLPEPDYMGNAVAVLVYLPRGKDVCIGFCDNDEYGVRWQCESTDKPTHWMPLPEPPEVTK